MKTIIYPLLTFIYKIFPFSLIKDEKKICFASAPDYSDNSLAVARKLISLELGYKIIWLEIGSNKKIPNDILRHIKRVKKNSLKGMWNFASSSIAFHTHGIYSFARGAGPLQINLWHGMPIKNVGFRDGKKARDVVYGDITISTSEYFRKITADSFGLPLDCVWLTGLPRNDVLINRPINIRQDLKNIFGIEPNKKLLFWLPTYRKSGRGDIRSDSSSTSFLHEWPEEFLTNLDNFCSNHDIITVIKIHPMDVLNIRPPIQNFNSLKIITAEQWTLSGLELYDALSAADALVSDISSVIVDYLITNKPIGITSISMNSYHRGVIEEVEDLLKCCHQITSEASFYRFIEGISLQDTGRNFEWVNKFYSEAVCDEHASERIIERVLAWRSQASSATRVIELRNWVD